MSSLLNMEFVQALNPLYAFPIVAVILCAFIVYAFGFKSPVQPPSFEGIEEEKKISKKRKTKETNKGKVIQNGKVNGNSSNKVQAVPSNKKKEAEKADKQLTAKSPAAEKKATKKAKSHNEKKSTTEKKKESISLEDTGEDGWVQLISKKGRKSRKKDEACSTENQVAVTKSAKTSPVKSSESIPSEESPVKASDIVENATPKNKPSVKEEEKKNVEVSIVETTKDSVTIAEDSKLDANSLEKENGRLPEESSIKSKKKKKKNSEAVNTNDSVVSHSESPAVQVISELSSQNANNNLSDVAKTPEAISGGVEENQPKELKSSNVVFDELADLYPEPKEQRKKKRVRRDH